MNCAARTRAATSQSLDAAILLLPLPPDQFSMKKRIRLTESVPFSIDFFLFLILLDRLTDIKANPSHLTSRLNRFQQRVVDAQSAPDEVFVIYIWMSIKMNRRHTIAGETKQAAKVVPTQTKASAARSTLHRWPSLLQCVAARKRKTRKTNTHTNIHYANLPPWVVSHR